jgi:hypothetical protein
VPNEATNENQPTNALQPDQHGQEATGDNLPAAQNTGTTIEPVRNNQDSGIILQSVPLPSFFEESIDIFQALPSPNRSLNQTHADLLSALQNEAISSTPGVDASGISLHSPSMLEANQSFTAEPMSIRDRLIEAEERESPFGNNNGLTARTQLSKYTKGPFDPIHYAHPTAVFDHLDVNIVGDWESLPNGKILAQPFGLDVRSIDKHPHLKSLLFAAVVDITNSHDVSVCAPRAKANSSRTPFSFLIYNITEEQARTLLERRIWSSPVITFSTSTINPSCPKYMFTIKGLTTMDDEAVHKMVKEVWHDQTTFTFLQRICETIPEHLKEQASHALQRFVNSLEVSRLDTKLRGNAIAPVFNIYADGPIISNDNIWSRTRAFLATRTYAIQAQDPGIPVIAPSRCSICHAANHPRGLCPHPLIEGWNGPKRREPPGARSSFGGN